MQQSDDALVREIERGSQAAMEVLIRRHYPSVFSLIYRKIGDYHSACDLTQEVFIKVAKSVASYRGDGTFKSWLMAISYHHCADHHRSGQWKRDRMNEEITSDVSDESRNVLRLLERKEERIVVKSALMQLPDYQRDVIALSYFDGLKIREIATLMGCSESTVKSRLYQGLRKLKQLLVRGETRDAETYPG